MTRIERAALAELALKLAWQAGDEIMRLYRKGIAVKSKAAASPVTEADEIADALIVAGLAAGAPGIPIVSEESVSQGRMPDIGGGRFWLVDPLDGTKEFISGTDEFTVNIALIESASPVLGALHAPALDECYLANGKPARTGAGNRFKRVRCQPTAPASSPAAITATQTRTISSPVTGR